MDKLHSRADKNDRQVHLRDRAGVCLDGTADSEENERDDWLARRRGRRPLFPRLVGKSCKSRVCVLARFVVVTLFPFGNNTAAAACLGVHAAVQGADVCVCSIGGAISNMYSVMIARYKYFPEVKTKGMSAAPRLVLFTSEHVRILEHKQTHTRFRYKIDAAFH